MSELCKGKKMNDRGHEVPMVITGHNWSVLIEQIRAGVALILMDNIEGSGMAEVSEAIRYVIDGCR